METVTAPAAVRVPRLVPVCSIVALVFTFTMFLAMRRPTPHPDDPVVMMQIIEVSLVLSALTTASLTPMTDTLAPAVTSESVIRASTRAGSWLPKASEISGSPRIASTALNRMFCDFQPIELKASVTPTVFPADWVRLAVLASSCERFRASTTTSPVVVVTNESVIVARACDRTTLVAITPPTAMESPPREPNEPPPEEMIVESAIARMNACSRARTVTLRAVTSAASMWAEAPPRTSFITTRPPTA